MTRKLDEFVHYIAHSQIHTKSELIRQTCAEFKLTQDRTVYYCAQFAVRFSYSSSGGFSNTVLSLSKLQKFDNIPMLVCLVEPTHITLFLANSTFLKKISHSSQDLSQSNIKGSFNGSDIAKEFNGITNSPANFDELFAIHACIGFEGNLTRLVEATTDIAPSGHKFMPTNAQLSVIESSVARADMFCKSQEFNILKQELDDIVTKYENEIIIASHIENINIRGRLIEYFIAGKDEELKNQLRNEINNQYSSFPDFHTKNSLGDYQKVFDNYDTQTDIKTKIVVLNSNPKAYNIDKFLQFMAAENSVFLFYFVVVNADCSLKTILISVFQNELLNSTIVLKHWAGRNSRGVTQFKGSTINAIIEAPNNTIEIGRGVEKLNHYLAL
ncbi:MAG: hypothetical protein RR980_01860 [Mucinivorans sp.]